MSNSDTRPTLVVYLSLCLLAVVPFLWVISPFALPIGMGIILAVIFQPIYQTLARPLPRHLAALLVTLALVVLVMGPITWFLVTVFQEAMVAMARLAQGGLGVDELLDKIVAWGPARRLVADPVQLRQQLQTGLIDFAKTASNATLSVVASTPSYLFDGAVCALTTYFLLLDGQRLFDWIADKLPLPDALRDHLAAAFQSSATAVVLSSMSAAASQTLVVLAAFLSLGTPLPFLAAFATFIFAWVPVVGIAPVLVAGALWHYLQHDLVRMGLMIGVGLVAGIVDNLVRPLVLKGRDAMHPLLSLLSIFGGIALFGMLGVFIGPVLASMAVAIVGMWPAVAKHCDIAVAENERLPEVDLPPPTPEAPVPPPTQ